ncbi:MAG: hypothetical protein NVSMB38_32310 [Ktedonobacteraceae bacterium]
MAFCTMLSSLVALVAASWVVVADTPVEFVDGFAVATVESSPKEEKDDHETEPTEAHHVSSS